MSLLAHFGVLRTIELRELLEDEEKINQIIRYSQKFQGLKSATENMLASNRRLAEVSLTQKTAFRDTKLLLARKYHELQRLMSTIQAKQDQLADLQEKNNIHMARWFLLKNIAHAEEECEVLFKKFAEGKMSVEDFSECFQRSRKLHHTRLVLVKKIQDIVKPGQKPQRPSGTQHKTDDYLMGFPEELPNTCHFLCPLNSAVILPGFYHSLTSVPVYPPFLVPIGNHVNIPQPLQLLPSHFDTDAPVCPRLYGQVPRWPIRPARLQRLNKRPRNNQQKPH